MRTLAPGKVVLSGAYSVLDGAPALVAAVDRYVLVDSNREGELLTDEVKAAGITVPYWFDASALRHADRKLGLGSSAAILVATLAAQRLNQPLPPLLESLDEYVYPLALAAHQKAQGGGSGIDVAAACYGGFLHFSVQANGTRVQRIDVPTGLILEVWTAPQSASTAFMLAQVRDYKLHSPDDHRRDLTAQATAAESTAQAWAHGDNLGILRGLTAQRHALQRLGKNAGIPIVTPQVVALAERAERLGAAILPAGAGGGDITLYVGTDPSHGITDDMAKQGHTRLPMILGAAGVHAEVNARKYLRL